MEKKLNTEPVVILTPMAKKKVAIRPYATRRMRAAARRVFLEYAKMNPMNAPKDRKAGEEATPEEIEKAVKFDEVPGYIMDEVNDVTVEHMVLSIDGNGDNILEQCLDMHDDDFAAVLKKCNEVADATAMTPEEKKSSQKDTPTP